MPGASPNVEPIPRAVSRLSHGCLALAAALFTWHALQGISSFKSRALALVMAALALAVIACFRLAPARRARIALALLPSLLVVHALEAVVAYRRPGPATAAARAGRPWDSRRMSAVVQDLRAEGKDAWAPALPRLLYKKRRRAVTVDGREQFPLGGVSSVTTVLCNESGTWAVYEADEHGFNNPKGIWSAPEIDLGLVGDSFTQGACVPREENLASVLGRRYPTTLNLAMLGNGPLLELAGVAELLSVKKPREVLWLYFHNDLTDLNIEKTSRILRAYLEQDGYRQGLLEAQPAVDAALRRILRDAEAEAGNWPWIAGRAGLTRARSPVWLQDLIMGERNSSASAVARLDHLLDLMVAGPDPEAPSARNPPDFALLGRVLERAAQLTRGWGGRLTFVYLPDLWPPGAEGTRDHPNREGVLEVVRMVGLPIIDVHAALRGRVDVGKLVYYPQSHCNGAGYAEIGRVILDALGR